jgi:signal transduction histidine kinase
MLAAMAHDIRTPLTRVQLRIEEVEPEELRDKLIQGIKEVRSIAEQSLELSSSLNVSEKSVPLDIVAFMQSRVDDFSEMGHSVILRDFPEENGSTLAVMAKPLSLKRCVDNILRNAVTYAGSAEVSINCSNGEVLIDICDNGSGIPEKYLERIFEPYLRLESSRNRETGGSGLGLSIARNMILLNNGSLSLTNRPEGGLQVRIVLSLLERS